jgi:hypothetical protein
MPQCNGKIVQIVKKNWLRSYLQKVELKTAKVVLRSRGVMLDRMKLTAQWGFL